jgi:uncharacterized protein DUF2637
MPVYVEKVKPKRRITLETIIGRFSWAVVVSTALALSAWSLYWVGRRYGLPIPLAAVVSACFDGAAITCADLALRYARTNGDSGLGPRIGVFTLAGISAFLNMQHAVLAHDPPAARVLFAMPPIVAVVLFEFHSRYARRGALRRAGRVPSKLPPIDRWAWLLFPARTLGVLRRIVGFRLELTASKAGVSASNSGVSETRTVVSGEFRAVSQTLTVPGETDQRAVREWARVRGLGVGDRGPVPQEVTTAYLAELTAGNPAASNGNGNHETESS